MFCPVEEPVNSVPFFPGLLRGYCAAVVLVAGGVVLCFVAVVPVAGGAARCAAVVAAEEAEQNVAVALCFAAADCAAVAEAVHCVAVVVVRCVVVADVAARCFVAVVFVAGGVALCWAERVAVRSAALGAAG